MKVTKVYAVERIDDAHEMPYVVEIFSTLDLAEHYLKEHDQKDYRVLIITEWTVDKYFVAKRDLDVGEFEPKQLSHWNPDDTTKET